MTDPFKMHCQILGCWMNLETNWRRRILNWMQLWRRWPKCCIWVMVTIIIISQLLLPRCRPVLPILSPLITNPLLFPPSPPPSPIVFCVLEINFHAFLDNSTVLTLQVSFPYFFILIKDFYSLHAISMMKNSI